MKVESEAYQRRATPGPVLAALVFPTLMTLVYFVWLQGYPTALQQSAYGAGKVLQFAFPAAWVWVVQSRRPRIRRPAPYELVAGAGFGVIAVAGFAILYSMWLRSALPETAVAAVRAKVHGLGVAGLPEYVALATFYACIHSFLEEYYWRWFVFGQLQEIATAPMAIGLSALGFMAHHVCVLAQFFGWNSWLTAFGSLAVASGGAVWALMYRRFGTLWGAWLSHLLVDAGIFLVGYDLVMR